MKKLYLLFLVLLILFIPKTFAVTPYRLDQQLPELNGFTLREVFENRNMAMPDLTGATEISTGVYRLATNSTLEKTIDYNINGIYIVDSLPLGGGISTVISNEMVIGQVYTLSYINISGSIGNNFSRFDWGDGLMGFDSAQNYTVTFTATSTNLIYNLSSTTNGVVDFRVQLEKGTQATPYQVPTNGPYSDIDVGGFNLTPEQIDMYYDYYLEAVEFENRGGISMEFFLISIFFMYILIMIVGYFTKSKYFYFAGSLLWLVPIFNYTNIFIITTSIIVFLIHLIIIFYSDKDDVFE